jgi:cation:H+ antiporter
VRPGGTGGPSGPDDATRHSWRRSLVTAAACAVLGVVVHYLGALLPVQLQVVGLGVGLVGAAFMLAWAADAGEVVFSGGVVLAVVSLVTVLPEFVIEIRFAFIQAAELVTANLTGATRLLLTGAVALPLVVLFRALARGEDVPSVHLAENRRLELGVLLLVSLFAIQVAIRGNLTVVDSALLVALYVIYARRVQGTTGEQPAVVGVSAGIADLPDRQRRLTVVGLILGAGTAVLIVANPFADALLATGTSLGVDPYLMIQSVVPVATESPEFVVVAVLITNHRPAQAMALFLASSVTQWTLGLGCLPIAYLAGGGGPIMPLAPREQLELSFTIAVTLFVVAALATLRPQRVDAALLTVVFLLQLIHPAAVLRVAATFVLLTFAVDLLLSRRRSVRPMLRAVWGRRSRPSSSA